MVSSLFYFLSSILSREAVMSGVRFTGAQRYGLRQHHNLLFDDTKGGDGYDCYRTGSSCLDPMTNQQCRDVILAIFS